jgi:hypothetical protein
MLPSTVPPSPGDPPADPGLPPVPGSSVPGLSSSAGPQAASTRAITNNQVADLMALSSTNRARSGVRI